MEPNQTSNTQGPSMQTPQTSQVSNSMIMAVLSYFGILIIIPFVTGAKSDPFVKFHMKQGLVLIISEIVGIFIGVLPVLGWIASPLLFIFNVVMIIMGIVHVVTGKQKELPFIGKFANKFNF